MEVYDGQSVSDSVGWLCREGLPGGEDGTDSV
jgi:hypothetical protein